MSVLVPEVADTLKPLPVQVVAFVLLHFRWIWVLELMVTLLVLHKLSPSVLRSKVTVGRDILVTVILSEALLPTVLLQVTVKVVEVPTVGSVMVASVPLVAETLKSVLVQVVAFVLLHFSRTSVPGLMVTSLVL